MSLWRRLSLAKRVNVFSFCKISREENKVAHNLAALASSSGSSGFWIEAFPTIVVSYTFKRG